MPAREASLSAHVSHCFGMNIFILIPPVHLTDVHMNHPVLAFAVFVVVFFFVSLTRLRRIHLFLPVLIDLLNISYCDVCA